MVPNMVIAYWAGEFGGIGKHFVDWGIDVSTLKTRGFYVHEIEERTASDLEFVIESFQATRKLHGFFGWGHGSKEGWFLTVAGMKGAKYMSYYNRWHPHYKMALGVIFACFSDTASSEFAHNGNAPAIFWGSPNPA